MNDECCFDLNHAQNRISYIEDVIKLMEPKIKKTMYTISANSREDIEQEVKLKIIESIDNIKFDETPGFWEYKRKMESSD